MKFDSMMDPAGAVTRVALIRFGQKGQPLAVKFVGSGANSTFW